MKGKFKPVIKSLLDTDLYKLTMLWVFVLKYILYHGRYEYKCRSDHDLLPYKKEIEKQLDSLCKLKFKAKEISWLRKIPFFPNQFIDYLESFQLKRDTIHVEERKNKLHIWAEGSIVQAMMFEIYVLKIVSEVYTRANYTEEDRQKAFEVLAEKCRKINHYLTHVNPYFVFVDFGSRRAFSALHHEEVVAYLKAHLPATCFVGTSNLYLAMKYDLKPIGTHAHEYQSFFQAIVHPLDSVKESLKVWAEVYGANLGIALTDTLGLDKFLEDFDLYYASLFAGVRHDSGCPFKFTDRIVEHYNKLGINPSTKTIVFSDGLTIDKAFELANYCRVKGIKCSFGIGTHLSFDIPEIAPVQSVMKIMFAGLEGKLRPVCKVSDNFIKAMGGTIEHVNYVLNLLGLKRENG